MDKPTCATCPFWDRIGLPNEGLCRRKTPNYTHTYHWPITIAKDWCGEHPDFNKWLKQSQEKEFCGARDQFEMPCDLLRGHPGDHNNSTGPWDA